MGSINAQLLAQKVSGNIRAGKKISLAKLAKEVGYSDTVADRPKLITETASYKRALALETSAIVADLNRELMEIQHALANKDKSTEEYKTLVGAMDTIIKNRQLLSGGATQNVAMKIEISEHVADKYSTTPQEQPDVKGQNGSTEPK